MSLRWRTLSSSALVAGLILASAPGCKSGGGWWSPSFGKWGDSGSSTSDLAVSRPPTKAPSASSTTSPGSSLATSRGTTGTQNGPYGAPSSGSGYANQPAAWQGEPHSSIAPAGGYQTGGQYRMAGSSQPGVTPGAYAQPSGTGGYPENRTASNPSAGAYDRAAAAAQESGSYDAPAANSAGSVYQDSNPGNVYAPRDSAGHGAPASSDAAGAASEPAGDASPSYGDGGSLYGPADAANPAAGSAAPAANPPIITNPHTLPPTMPPATSTTPTTAPATGAAPFTPPTLPSSLSATPGSYRPGSTAAPGSRNGAGSTIYEPPVTASGTGYSTADGTVMR